MGETNLQSFLSYRRDDMLVVGNVDRLYEQLSAHFGAEHFFMDVDTIPPGQDFRQVLDEAVARAGVLLAVMGPQWVKFGRWSQEQGVPAHRSPYRILFHTRWAQERSDPGKTNRN